MFLMMFFSGYSGIIDDMVRIYSALLTIVFYLKKCFILWGHTSLIELTPVIFNIELNYLDSEVSIYFTEILRIK